MLPKNYVMCKGKLASFTGHPVPSALEKSKQVQKKVISKMIPSHDVDLHSSFGKKVLEKRFWKRGSSLSSMTTAFLVPNYCLKKSTSLHFTLNS